MVRRPDERRVADQRNRGAEAVVTGSVRGLELLLLRPDAPGAHEDIGRADSARSLFAPHAVGTDQRRVPGDGDGATEVHRGG